MGFNERSKTPSRKVLTRRACFSYDHVLDSRERFRCTIFIKIAVCGCFVFVGIPKESPLFYMITCFAFYTTQRMPIVAQSVNNGGGVSVIRQYLLFQNVLPQNRINTLEAII